MRDLASGIVVGLFVVVDGFAVSALFSPTALESSSVVAASDVFGNFPSGFRVESGDSRDLLSTP